MKTSTFLFSIILCIVFVVLGLSWFYSVRCVEIGQIMNLNTKYSLTTSCMIEIAPKQWIPLKNYRKG